MKDWLKISLVLSIFGFLKEIRPSEPFIYQFLIDQRWRNLTEEDVVQHVYPVGIYSYLAVLIVVFLITDLCRYKPLIVVLGLSGVSIWGMLLWTKTLWELQIVEVLYGIFCATEVAYFTYIYAKVDKNYYQQVTGHTRAAILAGRTLSGILAQLLISLEWMNYRELNYITFSALIAATIWSLFLPRAKRSIYFHKEDVLHQPFVAKVKSAYNLMKTHFVVSYTNKVVVKWSLWIALSTCGFIQVQTYMQPLWTAIVNNPQETQYNGAVEAVLTVIGFLGAMFASVMKVDWKLKGDLTLSICSLLQGFLMLYTSQTDQVYFSYACYVAFGGLYHFMVTIASSEVAKFIEEDSFGFVFGINTFVALAVQTILTLIVVTDGAGFALEPREQYFVYGVFHVGIAVMFIAIGLANWLSAKRDYRKASIA